ncbi:hypothetical protein [Actinokineospora sp. NBRC 105648]|uniref:hypothetical protein n=1 Tax=Actinokineospora sp. NBRC 105648 TaxID=3032206 RepID=UPI0024A56AC1|nr:hypothetical protein [Actinokineospora sp. NBRC 105648]GLZ38318.1 hypothetical protein Acsp05_19420 [Actinokineospora sp. NBRC 105648]
MSGSLEVRSFLLQQDSLGGSGQFSTGVPAPRSGESARVSDEQVRRARLAVAMGAQGTEDCRELLEMLGLMDGEDGLPAVRR